MKKARSNFQCQYIYVQNYISTNSKNPKEHRTRHTPGHNSYMGKTNRCYQRKHQLDNWIKMIIIKLQKCFGKFLYSDRAIDLITFMSLNLLVLLQTNPTI